MGTAHDVCADCLAISGKLCDRCKPSVVPQLARNLGWLRLMGEAHAEQTALQDAEDPAVKKAERREARKRARSGYHGLLVHVRTALPPRRGEVEELNFDHRNYPPAA